MSPTVSIALATYNGADFLRAQLESLYAQTHRPIEIVASDDCSTDETAAILAEYAERRGLIVCEAGARLGFVRNFERALRRCTGDFIAFCDQDDLWRPDKIARLLEAIGSSALAFSDASLIDEHGTETAASLWGSLHVDPASRLSLRDLLLYNVAPGCTMLFTRELLDACLPIPPKAGFHDWWFIVQAARRGKVVYCPLPLIAYRQHSRNETGILKGRGLKHLRQAAEDARRLFAQKSASLHAMRAGANYTQEELACFENALACFDEGGTAIGARVGALLRNQSRLFPTRGAVLRAAFLAVLVVSALFSRNDQKAAA